MKHGVSKRGNRENPFCHLCHCGGPLRFDVLPGVLLGGVTSQSGKQSSTNGQGFLPPVLSMNVAFFDVLPGVRKGEALVRESLTIHEAIPGKRQSRISDSLGTSHFPARHRYDDELRQTVP